MRCDQLGDGFANDEGVTANLACCACGGGTTAGEDDNGDVCSDKPGWNDIVGDTCLWYANDNNCAQWGLVTDLNGVSANEACCVCGGGDY